MKWLKAYRLRKLLVERERLLVTVAALTVVNRRAETSSYYIDQWIEARGELAALEKRIEQIEA